MYPILLHLNNAYIHLYNSQILATHYLLSYTLLSMHLYNLYMNESMPPYMHSPSPNLYHSNNVMILFMEHSLSIVILFLYLHHYCYFTQNLVIRLNLIVLVYSHIITYLEFIIIFSILGFNYLISNLMSSFIIHHYNSSHLFEELFLLILLLKVHLLIYKLLTHSYSLSIKMYKNELLNLLSMLYILNVNK
jgi:hypothetical protein